MMSNFDIFEKLDFFIIAEKLKSYLSCELGMSKIENPEIITDKNLLDAELNRTEQMKDYICIEGGLEFSDINNIAQILTYAKIKGNIISSEKFLWILKFLKVSRNIKISIKSKNSDSFGKFNLLFEISEKLFTDKILEHHINNIIDENGNVRDNASPNLKSIRSEVNKKSEQLRKTLLKILKDVSQQELSREDILSMRDGRSVIPVKVENKRKVPGIIHSSSATGLTVFVEPTETIEINNEITELFFAEKREIEKILKELTFEIGQYSDLIIENISILSELDFLQAKAKFATEIGAIKPELTTDITNLKSAYHPVLMMNLGKMNVVPLDISFSDKYNCIIVTGPNAGGKTVALKTVGVLQLMLQLGYLVPVHPVSRMKIYNKVFVAIGDEQSIKDNLSSFSSHLKSIKIILEEADENTLILIDEICSGTDPKLGAALSKSIIENLIEKKSDIIVTTHMGDLKTFALESEKVQNASMEFDMETLSPNYKFDLGIPGQSFTFEIAQKYNIPENILEKSKNYSGNYDSKLEDLIKELSINKQKYEELKKQADINNSRLLASISLYDNRSKEIASKEKSILKEAKAEVEKVISSANRLIEKTIKEIREKENIIPKEIKNIFQKNSDEILSKLKIESEPNEKNITIKINDSVKLKDSNTSGIVQSINEKNIIIFSNGVIIKAKISDVEKTTKIKENISKSNNEITSVNQMPVFSSLDLRGLYPFDVEPAIEKFMYESELIGLHTLTIIHGKGTGKLREEVKKVLKRFTNVKSQRIGNWNEGDSGVTIIEI